jgi:hypothetical protein
MMLFVVYDSYCAKNAYFSTAELATSFVASQPEADSGRYMQYQFSMDTDEWW